jgi:hypothetical protein
MFAKFFTDWTPPKSLPPPPVAPLAITRLSDIPGLHPAARAAALAAEAKMVDRAEQRSRDDRLARIEHKLDTLIAALAAEGEEDPPVRSLDNGRTFAAREDKRGLG